MRDWIVELPDGRRVSVPPELMDLIDHEDFSEAGMWLPQPCADCDQDTVPREGSSEYYMVDDAVWTRAGAVDGHLCIGCLEARLGRTLDWRDFPDLPINGPEYSWGESERLRARKARPPCRRSHRLPSARADGGQALAQLELELGGAS